MQNVTTRELAQLYADQFDDVELIGVTQNGHTARFREADPGGGREFTRSRRELLNTEVVGTPFGAVEIGGSE